MASECKYPLLTNKYLNAALLIGFGTLEGYAFATSGMAYPTSFRSQMNFTRQILLQLFISAVGSSMLAQGIYCLFDADGFDNSRVWKYSAPGFRRVVGGCFLLGVGMAVAGSGPTMLPSQLGVGTTSALWILAGALSGGALYAIVEDMGVFSKQLDCKPEQKTVLEHHVGGSYAAWSIGLGSIMLAANKFLVPMIVDVSKDQSSLSRSLTTTPLIAGLAVGLNQIPIRIIAECGQGGSTSLMQIMSTLTNGIIGKRFKIKQVWHSHQLLYVWGGTLLGALIASKALSLPAPEGFSAKESFFGGVLMMFGARIAAGCTCGHGVSGFSELSIQSMAGAAAIFAGGIATVVLGGLATSP